MGNLRVVLTPDAANPNVGDLYLDDSGQLEWIGGDITDQESYARMVLQRIRCRLLLVRGEWYLDQRIGTPWREKVWVKGASNEDIRRITRDVVETTVGVKRLDTLTLSREARTLTLTLVVTTDMDTQVTTDMLDDPLIVEMPNG